jgi:hypothetical protein
VAAHGRDDKGLKVHRDKLLAQRGQDLVYAINAPAAGSDGHTLSGLKPAGEIEGCKLPIHFGPNV